MYSVIISRIVIIVDTRIVLMRGDGGCLAAAAANVGLQSVQYSTTSRRSKCSRQMMLGIRLSFRLRCYSWSLGSLICGAFIELRHH